jgi:methanogenic corrinoid protein MtbC1
LQLVKAVVDAGGRIGEIATLDDETQRRRVVAAGGRPDRGHLEEILGALERLEPAAAHRLLALQLSALGPVHFAQDVALPLVREIGERWAGARMGIAAEHLATGVLGSMLGAALQPSAISQLGPLILFATPPGERHEIGLQMAALTALGAGANPLYLGAELPVADLLGAAQTSGCDVVALGLVTVAAPEAERMLSAIRADLRDEVLVWIGGHAASHVPPIDGIERIGSLQDLERRVTLLGLERS